MKKNDVISSNNSFVKTFFLSFILILFCKVLRGDDKRDNVAPELSSDVNTTIKTFSPSLCKMCSLMEEEKSASNFVELCSMKLISFLREHFSFLKKDEQFFVVSAKKIIFSV